MNPRQNQIDKKKKIFREYMDNSSTTTWAINGKETTRYVRLQPQQSILRDTLETTNGLIWVTRSFLLEFVRTVGELIFLGSYDCSWDLPSLIDQRRQLQIGAVWWKDKRFVHSSFVPSLCSTTLNSPFPQSTLSFSFSIAMTNTNAGNVQSALCRC